MGGGGGGLLIRGGLFGAPPVPLAGGLMGGSGGGRRDDDFCGRSGGLGSAVGFLDSSPLVLSVVDSSTIVSLEGVVVVTLVVTDFVNRGGIDSLLLSIGSFGLVFPLLITTGLLSFTTDTMGLILKGLEYVTVSLAGSW